MNTALHRWKHAVFFTGVGIAASFLTGCCWSYFGVVYKGKPATSQPTATAISGKYHVRQYGGGGTKANWPTDLVLTLHEDNTITCSGDHSVFVKDFGVSETAIDASKLGHWEFRRGRSGFLVSVELTIGGVAIGTDLLRDGEKYGLGFSEGWGNDPDERNTLEFLQEASHSP